MKDLNWNIIRLETTGSTNEDAFHAGLSGAADGTVFVAGQQTAGRGRLDRQWFSPAGCGLYASVLVRPSISARDTGLLSFCSANAMNSALHLHGAGDSAIKWPNDIVIRGKKVCGILSVGRFNQQKLDFAVIGTGVNIKTGSYPEELSDRAACLEEMDIHVDTEELLRDYLRELSGEIGRLETAGPEDIIQSTVKQCLTIGREVVVVGPDRYSGTAVGIGSEGELIVETKTGEIRRVNAGDVSVRGIMGYT